MSDIDWKKLLADLTTANQVYFDYWGAEHETECPQDDTCDCGMVRELNAALRAATEALARDK